MKLTERTDLREYVSPEVWKRHGEKAIRFIDPDLILADLALVKNLEDELNRPISIIINNWHYGGDRVASGLRTPDSSYYRITSAHAWGRASDKLFEFKDGGKERVPNQAVYDHVLNNQELYAAMGIRRMEHIEDAPTWLHWDTMCHNVTLLEDTGKITVVRAR